MNKAGDKKAKKRRSNNEKSKGRQDHELYIALKLQHVHGGRMELPGNIPQLYRKGLVRDIIENTSKAFAKGVATTTRAPVTREDDLILSKVYQHVLVHEKLMPSENTLEKVFKHCDKDGDGFLSPLTDLSCLEMASPSEFAHEYVNQLVDEMFTCSLFAAQGNGEESYTESSQADRSSESKKHSKIRRLAAADETQSMLEPKEEGEGDSPRQRVRQETSFEHTEPPYFNVGSDREMGGASISTKDRNRLSEGERVSNPALFGISLAALLQCTNAHDSLRILFGTKAKY